MNGWDAPDNTKRLKIPHNECVDCGAVQHCVSSDSMDEHGRAGESVCNHCFGQISGTTECGQQSECRECHHYDPSYDE